METEKTMDQIAYEYFMAGDLADVLEQRHEDLRGQLEELDERYDQEAMTANEYDARKASVMARIAEVNDIRSLTTRQVPQNKRAHMIGKNGTITMWLGKDHSVWVETEGVKTVVLMDPTVSQVQKWRHILGIK